MLLIIDQGPSHKIFGMPWLSDFFRILQGLLLVVYMQNVQYNLHVNRSKYLQSMGKYSVGCEPSLRECYIWNFCDWTSVPCTRMVRFLQQVHEFFYFFRWKIPTSLPPANVPGGPTQSYQCSGKKTLLCTWGLDATEETLNLWNYQAAWSPREIKCRS